MGMQLKALCSSVHLTYHIMRRHLQAVYLLLLLSAARGCTYNTTQCVEFSSSVIIQFPANLDGSGTYAGTRTNGLDSALGKLASLLSDNRHKQLHKPLWPLSHRDIAGFSLTAIVLIIAASTGIGGGGLLVPLFLVVMQFDPSQAVALSNVVILGGTLVNLVFNLPRRHPTRPAPLINWDLILIMEPSTILGALGGGYINHLFPGWLTTVLLSVLLTFVTIRLGNRAAFLSRHTSVNTIEDKEDGICYPDSNILHSASMSSTSELHQPLLDGNDNDDANVDVEEPQGPPTPPPSPLSQFPWLKALIIALLVATVAFCNTIKHQVPCPSLYYLFIALAPVPVIVVTLVGVRTYLLRKAEKHRAAAHLVSFPLDDVNWTSKSTVVYPALCTFAGVCAGLFGVGGGIVKGPLMLEMGLPPEVAVATSATMILFTSASASVVFLSFGALPHDYGTALFLLGTVFTGLGQWGMRTVLRKKASDALIVQLMAVVMGLSAAVLAAQGGLLVQGAVQAHDLWHWGNVCGATEEA